MSKRLFLVRHGMAEEKAGEMQDFDRRLTPTGMRESAIVGKFIFQKYENPTVIASSNAPRAMETAELIAEQLKFERDKVRADEVLYEASVRNLLDIVHNFPEDISSAMIVGHNPSISYLADYLTEENMDMLEPAGFALVSFQKLKWADVAEKTGSLEYFIGPSEISSE